MTPYGGARARAWRNLMVAAINAGPEGGVFGLEPGDNRWPAPVTRGRRDAHVFPFEVEGAPALGCVSGIGFDELSIHVAFHPSPDAARWLRATRAGFWAGDAWAEGWLERRRGRCLQSNGPGLLPGAGSRG